MKQKKSSSRQVILAYLVVAVLIRVVVGIVLTLLGPTSSPVFSNVSTHLQR
jgi:hypothetical protein